MQDVVFTTPIGELTEPMGALSMEKDEPVEFIIADISATNLD